VVRGRRRRQRGRGPACAALRRRQDLPLPGLQRRHPPRHGARRGRPCARARPAPPLAHLVLGQPGPTPPWSRRTAAASLIRRTPLAQSPRKPPR
jgi:hypothetical protein